MRLNCLIYSTPTFKIQKRLHLSSSSDQKLQTLKRNALIFMKKMKPLSSPVGPLIMEPISRKTSIFAVLQTAAFLFLVFFIGSAVLVPSYKEKLLRLKTADDFHNSKSGICKNKCKPSGSETLPEGIVSKISNLEMRPLWGFPERDSYSLKNLFTAAVGIRQKDLVNRMVKKFLSSNFTVMLFHYDGVVDEWKDCEWNNNVVHVSARNQTKWWFAKRFLHPDIVAEYSYIFLWDEDLGVENFNPQRYLSIVKGEGLEISQPALDTNKSEIHQQLTARVRRSIVHRRTLKPGLCSDNSTAPPCTGWVEMMAPVFSRAAWRCVWYMIQNDLIHAWGLDYQLGYCAQGDRTKNIGVVDAEYIVHYGIPTLGGTDEHKESSAPVRNDPRTEVRRQSFFEFKIFEKRWKKAAEEDECWIDPYKLANEQI